MTPGKKLEGLVAATITPMTPDGQVNLSVIRQYVDYLVSEQNVKNIFGFGVAQTKAVMTFVSGIPMGPPRPPLVNASEEFIAKAKAKLDSIAWPDGD